jgi:hypothetical protein
VKRTPRSPRIPASFSVSLDRKLSTYTLAASAAGVGMLALAQPAQAKIVYTPTWVEIVPSSKIGLDLNNDGIIDFTLSNEFPTYFRRYDTFKVLANNNAVWGAGSYASALRAGVRIGRGGRFRPGHSLMAEHTANCGTATCRSSSTGPWTNATGRYLGLRFSVKGKIHYGWARFNVTDTQYGVYAALTGYAYETVPNTPIVTGKTKGPGEPVGSPSANPAAFSLPTTPPQPRLPSSGRTSIRYLAQARYDK